MYQKGKYARNQEIDIYHLKKNDEASLCAEFVHSFFFFLV